MALLPSWAPNLHPLVVHFPIAVLTAAVVADLIDIFMPCPTKTGTISTWLYTIGASLAVLAYFSGDAAARSVSISLDTIPVLQAHSDWAFRATWSFVFFSSIRLAMSYIHRPTDAQRLGTLFIAMVSLGALSFTVLYGSRLVFEHGVGLPGPNWEEKEILDEIDDR